MHNQQNGFAFDFTLELEMMRRRSNMILCSDDDDSANSNTGLCCCGATELPLSDTCPGNHPDDHTCDGSLLDHWQIGRIKFSPKTSGKRRKYIGMILPRQKPRSHCKELLLSILKSRINNKAPHGGESRLPSNLDVHRFPPRTSKEKLSLIPANSNVIIKNKVNSMSEGQVENPKTHIMTITAEDEGGICPENNLEIVVPPDSSMCPGFHLVQEYLGNGCEPLITYARRKFQLFKTEVGVDVFDAAPGSGRNRNYFGATTIIHESENRTRDISKSEYWTPFESVDILHEVMEALDLGNRKRKPEIVRTPTTQEVAVEDLKVEKIINHADGQCAQNLGMEPLACWTKPGTMSIRAPAVQIKQLESCIVEEPEGARNLGKIEDSSSTSTSKTDNDTNINTSSSPSSLFTLPLTIPRAPPGLLSSYYSSNFCDNKAILIVPAFESFDCFPPLSITNSNKNDSKDSASIPVSTLVPIITKRKIPSLMDLKIQIPSNDGLIQKKGKPRLPTIADAVQHSIGKHSRFSVPVCSSKISQLYKRTKATANDTKASDELRVICSCEEAVSSFQSLMENAHPLLTGDSETCEKNAFRLPCSSVTPNALIPLDSNLCPPLSSVYPDSLFNESKMIPKVLKISDRNEHRKPNYQQPKRRLFHSVIATHPPILSSEISQRVNMKDFIQNWGTTKGSMVCVGPKGKTEFKQISTINEGSSSSVQIATF